MFDIKYFSDEVELEKPFFLQEEQAHEINFAELRRSGATAFLFENEKEILALVWFLRLDEERVTTGCYMSKNAGPQFINMKRAFERLLMFSPCKRLEANCKTSFLQAGRMLKILGFEKEGTMKKFFRGENYDLYARCK